MGSMDIF